MLEIYRVRLKGKDARLLYDSRLVGLLGQPEALITTAAHALDYQFGFKVSETWFYRFLEKALAWLVLAQLGILVLSSCIAVIPPGETGAAGARGQAGGRTRSHRAGFALQAAVAGGPGLPLSHRTNSELHRGGGAGNDEDHSMDRSPRARRIIFWWPTGAARWRPTPITRRPATNQTGGHPTPPVSLLSVSIPVQFQITNLMDWAYVNQDPAALLQDAFAAGGGAFSGGRGDDQPDVGADASQAAETLRQTIQEQSNERELGVNITFVGLQDIHPPVKVAGDYEKVVSERESAEVKILEAQAHAILTNALARGVYQQRLAEAGADRVNAITNAVARADLFAKQSLAFAAAPGADGVYEHRAYLDVLAKSTRDAQKKIINATGNTNQIFEFNEEPKIREFGRTA